MPNPLWPLFDLEITTPRLSLRIPNDADLAQLVGLIADGIHDANEMPFSVPWTRGESPERERSALRYHWGVRSAMKPEQWSLDFGVWYEGRLVGSQGLIAKDFSVLREVSTGSWLVQGVQGRGIGKEMRAAVLWFAFEVLGAKGAATDAYDWNARSIGVTKALGYEPNGERAVVADGKRSRMEWFHLNRERWQSTTRNYTDVRVTGADACLEMLGAS